MTPGLTARLGAEIGGAGRGVLRLLKFDAAWAEGFDLSTDGYLRSFLAPLLGLPLVWVADRGWSRVASALGAAPTASFTAASAAHLTSAILYPLVMALLARPTGIAAGYAGFIVVTNWAGLFLNLAVAAAAAPLLLTGSGTGAFGLITLVLSGAYLFFVWRAGRELLSEEVAPVLMAVVLAVGVGALSDQVGVWLSS